MEGTTPVPLQAKLSPDSNLIPVFVPLQRLAVVFENLNLCTNCDVSTPVITSWAGYPPDVEFTWTAMPSCSSPAGSKQLRERAPAAQRVKPVSLANTPNMPLDVILEVLYHLLSVLRQYLSLFSPAPLHVQTLLYLWPIDLLNVSRSMKNLRKILMTRKNVFVWKVAQQNVGGHPKPPADLSEPAFASLLFNEHCYVSFSSFNSSEIDINRCF